MERVMSVEEKIRRAEEIYERRKQGETRPIAKLNINNKKDIKLLKKMVIQMIICIIIYLIVYTVQNNEFIFSQDFINNANQILSYDTNFIELYESIKNQVVNFIAPKKEGSSENMAIGGAVEQAEEVLNNEVTNINTTEENNQSLSQEEIDIQNIKETTTFIKPIEGIISSKYGYRDVEQTSVNISKNHTGTDIAADLGTKIKSATDGEVVLASEEGGYGKHIKVQIGEVSIIYAHCNNLYVKQGDKVMQGQEIAEVGSTGNSTGPHLHFEIRISERTVDPQTILEL